MQENFRLQSGSHWSEKKLHGVARAGVIWTSYLNMLLLKPFYV